MLFWGAGFARIRPWCCYDYISLQSLPHDKQLTATLGETALDESPTFDDVFAP